MPSETLTQLLLGLTLELSHSLAAEVEALADLLEGQLLPAEDAEAVADDVALAVVERDQRLAHQAADLLHVQVLFLVLGLPVLIIAPILILTYRKFPLTPLLYRLLFVHALILILGGHYTYARVPVGFWFQDLLDLSRNHYDRLGHFAQGFVPAILVREILLRRSPLVRGKWLFFLTVCVCLAFSALRFF